MAVHSSWPSQKWHTQSKHCPQPKHQAQKHMQGPSGGDLFTFQHALTPYINEKQEMTKERTENVCAHRPYRIGVLTFKKHDSFPQPAIPGEEIKRKQKYHHKTTHIEKEPHDKRIMEAPTQE